MKESPAGSNHVKYNNEYYGSDVYGFGFPWSVTFLWWVFLQAGASHLFYGGNKTSYAPNLLGYHEKRNQAINEDFMPGDIIFFDLNGDGRPDQAGICESWDGANIITIDGYISDGSEADWHSVMRCSRHGTHIFGAYRPDYREELK